MEKDLEIFRSNLKSLLLYFGWTQQYLADQLDVSRAQISNMIGTKSVFTKRHYLAIQYVIGQEYKNGGLSEEQFEVFKQSLVRKISKVVEVRAVVFED